MVLHRPVELAGIIGIWPNKPLAEAGSELPDDRPTYREWAISMMPSNDQKEAFCALADGVANGRVGLLLFGNVDNRFADEFDSAAYKRLHLA
jgi:hypothetical protein